MVKENISPNVMSDFKKYSVDDKQRDSFGKYGEPPQGFARRMHEPHTTSYKELKERPNSSRGPTFELKSGPTQIADSKQQFKEMNKRSKRKTSSKVKHYPVSTQNEINRKHLWALSNHVVV